MSISIRSSENLRAQQQLQLGLYRGHIDGGTSPHDVAPGSSRAADAAAALAVQILLWFLLCVCPPMSEQGLDSPVSSSGASWTCGDIPNWLTPDPYLFVVTPTGDSVTELL